MRPRNVVIWAAMLVGVLAIGGVAYAIVGRVYMDPPPPLASAAVVFGIAGPVVGHLVRFTMRRNPSRFILSFALGEAGALAAAVVWMLTRSTVAMSGYLVAAVGFMSLYPGAPEDIS